jgi:spore coat protein CotH
MKRLTLNAMTQDTSKIHEYGAYALFNAMGVPASKTGWARVYVNGVDRGLYLNVEQPDEVFASKRFKDK